MANETNPKLHSKSRTLPLLIAMTLFAALGGLAPSAEAQAAHFSYAQVNVNIQFDVPTGIALDGSGNIFVTDKGALSEISSPHVITSIPERY